MSQDPDHVLPNQGQRGDAEEAKTAILAATEGIAEAAMQGVTTGVVLIELGPSYGVRMVPIGITLTEALGALQIVSTSVLRKIMAPPAVAALLWLGLLLAPAQAQVAALLPNGQQQFTDGNGVPYSGGTVTFYVPNSTTLKGTWLDPNQTVANANPLTLDAAGRAVIYGTGQYRQVLRDSAGNTIWDQLTFGASAITPSQLVRAQANIGASGAVNGGTSGLSVAHSLGTGIYTIWLG